MKNNLCCIGVLAVCSMSFPSFADIKIDPADYVAAPKGTNMVMLYQQNAWANDAYSGGKKSVKGLDMKLNLGIVRLIHFTEFFNTGYVWDPQILIPVGRQKNGLTDDKYAGIGDISVGATLWTINRPEQNEYLGWSAFITAPTGRDKNKGYALSNNRWAADLQVGYVKGLTDKVTFELVGETEFYTKQRKTHSQKRPLFQIQNHWRYNFTENTHAAITFRQNWGAKERLDDESIATSHNNSTFMFTLATMVTPKVGVQAQWLKDISIREGAKIDNALQFRLVYAF